MIDMDNQVQCHLQFTGLVYNGGIFIILIDVCLNLKLQMEVISRQDEKRGKVKSVQKDFFDNLTQCFSEYFSNMFRDFGQIIGKKIELHERKIQIVEQRLKEAIQRIDSRNHLSLTSLAQIQLNQSSNQTSRVKSHSVCSTIESVRIEQVNQALRKLQQGIGYLQASLTTLKSKKEIQDPESSNMNFSINQIQGIASELKQNSQSTSPDVMNKIQKLATKINKFAKETSVQQIERDSEFIKRPKHQKSLSLISLSSRRYHPVSCPKRYQYGSSILRKNQSQSQIFVPGYQQNSNISQMNSQLLLDIYSHKGQQNKMPLINKAKQVLNQLLSLVKDEADANVVKFYLKKSLKNVGRMVCDNNTKVQRQYLDRKNDIVRCQNGLLNVQGYEYVGKTISEYFADRNNTLAPKQTINNNSNKSGCYKAQLIPNSGANLGFVKENYSMINCQNFPQRTCMISKQDQSVAGMNLSRQKRKYFQRTSNDQKGMMLKGKLKSYGNH